MSWFTGYKQIKVLNSDREKLLEMGLNPIEVEEIIDRQFIIDCYRDEGAVNAVEYKESIANPTIKRGRRER